MSIDKATAPISEYVGDGSANTFGMIFPAGSSSELLIYLRYVGDDAVIAYDLPGNDTELYPMQPLVEGVDYTLSNLNIPNVYGSLSLIDAGQQWIAAGKLDTDWNLIIRYDLDAFQPSSFRDLGVHAPINFEKALDRLTMILKGMKYRMFDATLATEVIDTQGKGIKIWATGANYFAGDFLVLGDDLYRCLADHVAGATFVDDAAHWDMLLDETMDEKDAAQSIALGLVMDAKDDAQTIVLEGTMDTKDAAQSVVLEASMTTKDNIVRGEFAAADTIIQDAVDAIEVKTDNITVTQPVNLDEMEAAIAGGGSGTISEWKTGIVYALDAIIWEGEDFYRCITQHTSGATFLGDAANWSPMSSKLTVTEVKALLGITGDAVGTTDAQALTTKTISASEILDSKIVAKTDTLANLTTYALTATNGELLYASDTKEYYGVKDTLLVPLGGGGGGISEWVTATEYSVDDVIWEGTEIYVCTLDHTSGATFVGDAANWTELSPSLDEATLVHNGGEATGALTLGTITDSLVTFIRNNSPVAWIGTVAQGWLFGIKTVHQGGIDADNKVVENIPTPTADGHAVNKVYVDPLYQINKDRGEPAGFIRDNQATMGIIELCPRFVDSSDYDLHRVYQDGTFATSIVGHPFYDVALTNRTTFYDNTELLASRKLCLSPVSGTDMEVYIDSVKHVFAASQSVVFPDQSGMQFVYFNASGVLSTADTVSKDFLKTLPIVSLVYGNATTQELVTFADERHGIVWDGDNHVYEHFTGGARYAGGMDIAGLADGLNTHGLISEGFMYDEDLFQTLPDQATMPFWYIEGTDWRIIQDGSALGLIDGADTYISFNEDIAGTFQLTEMTGVLKCTIMFILATNDKVTPYIKVVGQNQYDSPNEARDAIGTELSGLVTEGLPTPEFVFVAGYIIRRDGDLEALDDGSTHVDLRTIKVNAQGAGATAIVDHRKVTNRDALDQHPISAITDLTARLSEAGAVDRYKILDNDAIKVADWDATGKLGASFVDNITGPLAGVSDYEYNTDTDTGAEVFIDFPVPVRSRADQSSTHKIQFPFIQTGTEGTIECEIYDVTNLAIIKTINLENVKNRYLGSFTMPALCTELRFKIKSITDGVAGLNIDQISFSDKFGEYGSETIIDAWRISQLSTALTEGTNELELDLSLTADITDDIENNIFSVADDSANTRTIFAFNKDGFVDTTFFTTMNGSTSVCHIYLDGVDVTKGSMSDSASGNRFATSSFNGKVLAGQVLTYYVAGTIDAFNSVYISIKATAQSQTVQFEDSYEQGHVVSSFKLEGNDGRTISNTTEDIHFIGTGIGWSSVGDIHTYTIQKNDTILNMRIGIYISSSVAPSIRLYKNGAPYKVLISSGTTTVFNTNYLSEMGEFIEGDILSLRTSVSMNLSNDSTYHYLNITEEYLPPVEQATPTRLLSVKQSLENDFDVDASSAGVLSNFNPVDGWLTFVSYANGAYVYDLNEDIFTVFPKLASDTPNSAIGSGVVKGSFPRFTVQINVAKDDTATAYAHSIEATKRGADRSDRITHVLNGDDVVKVNHKTTEFDTGETWIDGRKIYGRSFEVTSDITVTTTIETLAFNLEIINGSKLTSDLYHLGEFSTDGSTVFRNLRYVPSTGVLRYEIGGGTTVASGSKLTIKYVKP